MLALLIVFPVASAGEGKVFTKKVRLSDFTTKTTKVVMTGNAMLDAAMKDEVASRWQLSPYEFCSVAEYDRLKFKPDYYFLRIVRNVPEGVSGGVMFLSLLKGGKEKNPDSLDRMFEVISLPLAPTEFSSGREFLYIGAFLEIIQNYVEDAMEADTKGYAGLASYNARLAHSQRKKVWLSRDDIGFDFTDEQRARYLSPSFVVADEDEVDRVFRNGTRGALVSIVVAPVSAQNRAWCYKMLISADTHQLYYYSRHRISFTAWKGFQLRDIKAIASRERR